MSTQNSTAHVVVVALHDDLPNSMAHTPVPVAASSTFGGLSPTGAAYSLPPRLSVYRRCWKSLGCGSARLRSSAATDER